MLPNEGDIVLLVITSVFTPQRFFAQMPMGTNTLTTETGEGVIYTWLLVMYEA